MEKVNEKRIRKYRKRLLINIPPELHQQIVERAKVKETTITKYVSQAIAEAIIKDLLT